MSHGPHSCSVSQAALSPQYCDPGSRLGSRRWARMMATTTMSLGNDEVCLLTDSLTDSLTYLRVTRCATWAYESWPANVAGSRAGCVRPSGRFRRAGGGCDQSSCDQSSQRGRARVGPAPGTPLVQARPRWGLSHGTAAAQQHSSTAPELVPVVDLSSLDACGCRPDDTGQTRCPRHGGLRGRLEMRQIMAWRCHR